MVFTFSALYHYHSAPALKDRFEIWDHIGIYFMIAGTYTPFIIAYADQEDRILLLFGVWALAVIGSVFKYFFPARFRILSMLLYVVLGLLWFLAPASFKENVPTVQFYWILAGAIVYCSGLFFYVKASFKHHHAVWHLFVLVGACCHYVGVITMFV
jgi:hemolysin III